MHLDGDGAGFGLALALQGRAFAQVGEIRPAHSGYRFRGIAADLFAAAIVEHDLEVHLGLAAEAFDVGDELALVGADRPAQGFVVCKDSSKTERQNGGSFEAVGDDTGVLDAGLLGEVLRGRVFADDNG